jgi:hypothetical protein
MTLHLSLVGRANTKDMGSVGRYIMFTYNEFGKFLAQM